MRTELMDLLTAYLSGWKTIRDCAEWLASLSWDDPSLDQETGNLAGRLELLATEEPEGLRPEADFWQDAAELIVRETGPLLEDTGYLAELDEALKESQEGKSKSLEEIEIARRERRSSSSSQ